VSNLLGAAEIRSLAEGLNLKPTKKLGQNFVIDGNTCRKIVKLAAVEKTDIVLEIGPGLGSLTLALLEQTKKVIAIEIDKRLADQLPITVSKHGVDQDKLEVINMDALIVRELPINPTLLVANLPYNVSVPVLLNILEHFPTITRGVVMVQSEVADRLAAKVNSKDYGSPTVKANWWASLKIAGEVSRSVFWPIPNVDSSLVRFDRHLAPGSEAERVATFSVVDHAFAKRRKMLRSSLSQLFKSDSQLVLNRAGIDPTSRGEVLSVAQFLAIGQQLLNDKSTK
jgi:16S rRNA (adenine1518-N6/adenine1519-N6)-dimethyltransferase